MDFGDVIHLARKDESVARRALRYIGRPGEVAQRATLEAVERLSPLRDEILGELFAASSESDALARLERWAQRRRSMNVLAPMVYEVMAKTDMAGQLFVRDVEVHGEEVKLQAGDPPPTFLNQPFPDAVAFAEARGLMDDEGIAELLRTYRERGMEAEELLVRELQQRTARGLQSFTRDGGTLRDFIAGMEREALSLGITPQSHGYLETVFRTSVQSAYGAGRVRAMRSEYVREARPYVELRTVGDDRVSEYCSGVDGKQWAIDDPAWEIEAPPRHYNCRTSVVTLAPDEVDEAALSREVTSEQMLDFAQSPLAAVEATLI